MRKRSQVARATQQATRSPALVPQPSADIRAGSNQSLQVESPPRLDYVLNAFEAGDHVAVIMADRSFRRIKAEHSFFVRTGAVPNIGRALRKHPAVRWVKEEGDWLRVACRDRIRVKKLCKDLSEYESGVIETYEGNISPVLRWMVDNDIRIAEPRTAWVDLETDSRVPFSRKEEARTLCWVVVDAKGNEWRGILEEDTDEDERRLYRELWDVLGDFDQVAAWNGDRFDFPVIKARTEKHSLARCWGPAGWRRWLWLDHLELFRRMNTSTAESGEEKTSFRLDAIAQAVLGEGKHDFDASKTWEAWAAGGDSRQELLDYCAQDTRLMPRIEERTGYMTLLRTLGDVCGTFADSRGIQPSVQVDSYMQRLAARDGKKLKTALRLKKGDQYLGAFVLKPTKGGIMRDVHVADFSSLYPSIIRTWRMSPETLLTGHKGRALGETDMLEMYGEDRPEGTAYSPLTDCYFDTTGEALLADAVAEMMRLRKEWNAKKASEPPGTDAWKDADRRSTAYKIAANSFYGVIGQSSSRFFNRYVAESITQCGKWLIQLTMRAAEDDFGMTVVYGDTDSLFIEGATRAEFERFVEWCNAELYPRELKELGCPENHINLAYEKQFDRLIMSAAKKYCGSFVHYKGTKATADSKPEIKGFEYKRGDSIRLARQLQEVVVDMLVGHGMDPVDDPTQFEPLLDEWLDRVLNGPISLEEIVTGKRLSRPLDGYVSKAKKDGTPSRQPPQVEVAKVLKGRGYDVDEGARISYFVLDGSGPVQYVPAEDWQGECDRYHVWEKQTFPPTLRILEAAFPAHDWKRWKKVRPKKPRVARAKG